MNDHLSEEEKAAVLEQIPAGRFGTTEDIAKTVVQLLEATDYLTGQLITVDGGWT
jgi:3-oxoacyl-[acyl-carrier protein] reductase